MRTVVPNHFVLRAALFRGVGQARAAGITDRSSLVSAALDELAAWASQAEVSLAVDQCRVALIDVAGGPGAAIWNEPLPPRDTLPAGLDELVRFAIERYGASTMWWMDRSRALRAPQDSWKSVVAALRNHGGPDPRPFWLAQAIEQSAAKGLPSLEAH